MFPSLLLKFKAWLRQWLMVDAPKQLNAGGEKPISIRDGAAQLVDRARMGDQNAIALICQVRDNAQKKQPRAQKAYKALMDYVQKNPVTKNWSFGEDAAYKAEIDSIAEHLKGTLIAGEDEYEKVVIEQVPDLASKSIGKAIVALANGPSLLANDECNRFKDVADSLSEGDRVAFMTGCKHGMRELDSIPQELQGPFLLGHILGTARRIQAVRLPNVAIGSCFPSVGAEFGE